MSGIRVDNGARLANGIHLGDVRLTAIAGDSRHPGSKPYFALPWFATAAILAAIASASPRYSWRIGRSSVSNS